MKFRLFCLNIVNLIFFFCIAEVKQKRNVVPIKYDYELACAAMFQNEAIYLKEWLEFHKLVGFQHFYLYNNNSTDNYLEILKPYIDAGEVELIDWPYQTSSGYWINIQCDSYKNALERSRGIAKWLACLDLDEFLFPVNDITLIQFLKRYEECGAIGVNWQLYGTSYVEKISPDDLTIDLLTHKAECDYPINKRVKCIIQPIHVIGCKSPHEFFFEEGFNTVTSRKERIIDGNSPYVAIESIRINHYWTRDEEYFKNEKIPKRLRHGDKLEFIMERYKDLNQVVDTAISRYIPALKKKLCLK